MADKGLDFGTIIAGTPSSVQPTDPGAAQFHVGGLVMAATYANLQLPTTLTKVGGGASMPVSFCALCGMYRLNNTNPVGATAFNPNSGFSGLALTLFTTVYIWVGGTANPPAAQAPGSYTGTMVLTIGLLL
ncbi:MAG TPA: DUF4402 domain-containing protein [Gemmatimonadaceae bacterium]